MCRWLCALILAVPFGVAQAAPPAAKPAAPVVAATVNGETITLDQVDAVLRRMRTTDGPLSDSQVKRLRQAIVQDLIDDTLLRQHLRKHGPKVEQAELDKHMAALSASLRRQGKTLADYCREAGRTEEQVRDSWATMVQFQRYVDQQATDEKLRKYYEASKDLFDRVQVRVSHIVIRLAPETPPTERAAAKQKLATLRSEILAGKTTFADAARKYSMSPSAPKGGDLGFISLRDPAVDEAVSRAAFAQKASEISEPIEGEFGVHLVQATERKAGTPTTFDKVSDLVRECYAEDIRQGLVGLLRQQASIQVTLP